MRFSANLEDKCSLVLVTYDRWVHVCEFNGPYVFTYQVSTLVQCQKLLSNVHEFCVANLMPLESRIHDKFGVLRQLESWTMRLSSNLEDKCLWWLMWFLSLTSVCVWIQWALSLSTKSQLLCTSRNCSQVLNITIL